MAASIIKAWTVVSWSRASCQSAFNPSGLNTTEEQKMLGGRPPYRERVTAEAFLVSLSR
jgi:hypothetical protein